MKKKKSSEEVSEEKAKKKEQKVIYIDDGSTVADMSGTYKKGKAPVGKGSLRDQAKTFFGVMKKMILPMLITLLALALVYLFVQILAWAL